MLCSVPKRVNRFQQLLITTIFFKILREKLIVALEKLLRIYKQRGWGDGGYPLLQQLNIHEWKQCSRGWGVPLLSQINIHEWEQGIAGYPCRIN